MKKHLLFLSALIVATTAAFAQSTIQIIDGWSGTANGQTYDIWADISDSIVDFTYDVKNTGTVAKDYLMKRQEFSLITGTENYICWDQCYAPFVSQSPTNVAIASNGTYNLSSCHYKSHGYIGTSIIRYVFWDQANVNDSAWFIVNWHLTGVGINETNSVSGNISAYPNPAVTNTTIKYDLNGDVSKASLKIYDLMGSVVKEVKLTNTSGTVTLSIADLEQGIYFYSIMANDKTIATRKLVVTH